MAIEKSDIGSNFKPIPNTIPLPDPPVPDLPSPAMSIEFQFPLGEFVKVKNIAIMGNITCAAIAFHSQGNIYLIDTGIGLPRWYPESQLESAPLRDIFSTPTK